VKLDYLAHFCDVATHGHVAGWDSFYAIDAGLADVLDSLRAVNPRLALEPLVCGTPPSPWWTMKTPFVSGPAGDDVPHGRVPCPEWMEALISARDIAYRARQEEWIMPTQAVETFDIVMQCPGAFENLAAIAIGRGRWFISTYLKPELMSPQHWDFLAALVRWARANNRHLGNARLFGGRPELREAYGYLFHNADKDIFCVRNPWIEERTIQLPACKAVTEPRELRMIFPRRAVVARLEPGEPGPQIAVAPYETAFFETVPAHDDTVVSGPSPSPSPEAGLTAGAPLVITYPGEENNPDDATVRLLWQGTLAVPQVAGVELCVLIEGTAMAQYAGGRVWIDGRETAARKTGNAGQFAAASYAPPEHWTWLLVPITPGVHAFKIDVQVPDEEAVIGVFLRGTVPATNDPAPESGAAFPVYQPDRRAWSQTLLPMRTYPVVEDATTP
jgi:hypothetical protein